MHIHTAEAFVGDVRAGKVVQEQAGLEEAVLEHIGISRVSYQGECPERGGCTFLSLFSCAKYSLIRVFGAYQPNSSVLELGRSIHLS